MKILPLILVLLSLCACENGKTDNGDSQPASVPSKADSMPAKSDMHGSDEVAVNDKCPIANEDVDTSVTTTFNDETVAFCCGSCKTKFEGMSDEEKAAKVADVRR